MASTTETMEATIPQGRTLRIQNGKGVELRPAQGCIWVTHEGETDDVVVEAGGTLRVTRDGLTLVHAFEKTRLGIAYPSDAGAPSMTFGGGYREVGTRIVAAMLADWMRGIRDRFATAVAQRAVA
jgi:Protein of unknown function (DUF2917)